MAVFHPDGTSVLFGTTARTTHYVPIVPTAIEDLARKVIRPPMSDAYRANYRARIGDSGNRGHGIATLKGRAISATASAGPDRRRRLPTQGCSFATSIIGPTELLQPEPDMIALAGQIVA